MVSEEAATGSQNYGTALYCTALYRNVGEICPNTNFSIVKRGKRHIEEDVALKALKYLI